MKRADRPTELDEAKLRQSLPRCTPRDRLLIELGFETGLRLSELLDLRVGDVWRDGAPGRILRVTRQRLKGGRGRRARSVSSRVIALNARARAALLECLGADRTGDLPPEAPLFPSRKDAGAHAISRQQGGEVIRKIFLAAGLDPHRVWAGHSLRRRFVRKIYDQSKDINLAQAAVGHRWVATTQLYLGLDEEEAQAAILRLGEEDTSEATTAAAVRIS